ncbi:MAG: AMMECR1 domain-containing protein [Helicobacteraceae bacterium CG2_30_36_10]|nr:MAG: AMMECR1 domain-containing protein [Helicobacteraceae bacterium CG2_30_36_10]
MARSVLLQLARDSIAEVLEAKRTIDKRALLTAYPLLNEQIATTVNIYVKSELKGSYSSIHATKSLLEDIIYNAKKSAFEDENSEPITTSHYLHCEIELLLTTPEGVIKERDYSII